MSFLFPLFFLPSAKTTAPIFTALHVMQTRSSDENSVRLSVRLSLCPSHAWIVTKRQKDLSRFIYHTKKHLAYFSQKKNGWRRANPSTWKFRSTDPRWSEIADFQLIIARSSSAVTPSEKSSINANGKSTTRFPMSLRWSSYVSPKSPMVVSKTQNGRFTKKKLHIAWRKCATKFLCVKTVIAKVVRHSLA